MSPIKIFMAMTLATASTAQAESPPYQAVLPVGAIHKNATITVQDVDANTTYFNPAEKNSVSTDFKNYDNSTLYKVNTIETEENSADAATLQSLANNNQLVVSKSDLSAENSEKNSDGTSTYTLSQDVPVYKSGSFNFWDWFLGLFGIGNAQATTKPLKSISTASGKNAALANAVEKKVEQGNSLLSQNKSMISGPNCQSLPKELQSDKKFNCGLQQALAAFNKAKSEGKVTQNIFMFNDFSSGGVMGKMYFFNADGTLANVTDKNPIWASRGEGGFGQGAGSMRTPNGALVTRAYRPPRFGNVKDGIELDGLEPGNQDIHSRGVLLHGWDPYTPTEGCIGIAGSIDTNRSGKAVLGGDPPYLDQLKKGFLKDGGAMIYNFTPQKVESCTL